MATAVFRRLLLLLAVVALGPSLNQLLISFGDEPESLGFTELSRRQECQVPFWHWAIVRLDPLVLTFWGGEQGAACQHCFVKLVVNSPRVGFP